MTGADADGILGGHIEPPPCSFAVAAPELDHIDEINSGAHLKAQNEQLAAANISYRISLPRLQAGAVRLGGSANRCRADVADALSRHGESLKSDCAKLLAALHARTSRQEALEDENKGLQSEVDDLERRARAEVAEAQRLKKELERKGELYEEIKAAFDEERDSLEKAQQDSSSAGMQLQQAKRRLAETQEELNRQLREEKKRAADAEGDLKRQLDAAQTRIHRAEEMWSESQSQLRGVEVTLREALSVHEERVRERETERQEAEAAIERERGLKDEEARAKRQAEERAEAAEERAQAEISRVAKAVQAAKDKQAVIDAQAAEITVLKETAASMEKELASLRQTMHEESARAASDKRTGMAIERCSAAKLRTQVTQLEGKMKEQRNVHKARMEEMERYCEVQIAKARAEGGEQQKAQIEGAVKELREQIRRMDVDQAAALAEVRAHCEESVRHQQEDSERHLRQLKSQHALEIATLREGLVDLSRERDEAKQQCGGEAELLREELAKVQGLLAEEKEGREKDKEREVAVLETMEMSLLGLTSKLRAKDGEVQALQATVRRECEERMDLTCQVAVLKQQISAPLRSIADNHQHTAEHEREAPRAPSCPPMTGHLPSESLHRQSLTPPDPPPERTGGWGLPAIGSRGPSPAQKQEARLLKEQGPRSHSRRFR